MCVHDIVCEHRYYLKWLRMSKERWSDWGKEGVEYVHAWEVVWLGYTVKIEGHYNHVRLSQLHNCCMYPIMRLYKTLVYISNRVKQTNIPRLNKVYIMRLYKTLVYISNQMKQTNIPRLNKVYIMLCVVTYSILCNSYVKILWERCLNNQWTKCNWHN